jgi:tRNA-modifying protein YgfZ
VAVTDLAPIPSSLPALDLLRRGARLVHNRPAVFRMEGPGAVECLQGLLTSDVVRPGTGTVVYGALLTPKGMIMVDCWSLRDARGFTLIADRAGREVAVELFRKQVPPRLARVTDRTDEAEALWLIGRASADVARSAGLDLPADGQIRVLDACTVAIPGPAAPMAAVLVGPRTELRELRRGLLAGGAVEEPETALDVSRLLAGWPTLGREIGDRTLPQEVRFDEIDGVSYTKGCYVGQETVARVHFRGHPNRLLRGLSWEGEPPGEWTVRLGEREIGKVTSAVQVEGAGLGLALIRREVAPGTAVSVGGTPAVVVALPFPAPAG